MRIVPLIMGLFWNNILPPSLMEQQFFYDPESMCAYYTVSKDCSARVCSSGCDEMPPDPDWCSIALDCYPPSDGNGEEDEEEED